MPGIIILLIVLGSIFTVICIVVSMINDKKKVEIAKENFRNSRTLQNTMLQKILVNAEIKAWTIKDFKKRQGENHTDFASRKDEINNVDGIYSFLLKTKILALMNILFLYILERQKILDHVEFNILIKLKKLIDIVIIQK